MGVIRSGDRFAAVLGVVGRSHRSFGLPAVAVAAVVATIAGAATSEAAAVSAKAATAGLGPARTRTQAPSKPQKMGGVARGAERVGEAKTVDLEETGYLKAIGEPGAVVEERGHATGTYVCGIEVKLTIGSAGHVTARFTVRPKGGSVTGTGTARFEQKGADGYFGGTLAVDGGSGGFKHVSGSDIGISGVIDRETLALTVHVHGQIEL